MKAGGFLAGRPEDIIEQLKAVEKRCPDQLADLDRFAKEVFPAFRDTRTAAAAAVLYRPPGAPFGGTSASPAGRITKT